MLAKKLALVTGGARGIGAGIVRALAAQGARVAILDLDGAEAGKTAASLPAPGMAVACDAASESDVARAVLSVAEQFGGLDIVVNNAGVGRGPSNPNVTEHPSSDTMSGADWDGYLSQNLKTTFLTTKAALPHLKARGGAVVNIASIAALVASPGLPAYAAAKAGVVSLTKSWALDWAQYDIRVNAICPGYLWTRAWEGLARRIRATTPALAELEPRQVFDEMVKRRVPLGREQTPDDIGQLAAFLASDLARNITGQWIAVDGGITLRQI